MKVDMAYFDDKTGVVVTEGPAKELLGYNLTGRAIRKDETYSMTLPQPQGTLLAIREIGGELVGRWEPEADVLAEALGE